MNKPKSEALQRAWSEPMSVKALISGSVIYLLANLASAVLPFALLPVLTRFLGPAEYGLVAMFQALVAGLGAVVGVGVVGAAARKYYDADSSESNLRDFVGVCTQITLVTALLALLAIFFFRAPIDRLLGLGSLWTVLAVAVASASAVVQLRLGQWQVRSKPSPYAILQIAQSSLAVVFSLIMVVVFGAGADGRIGAIVLAIGLSAVAAVWSLQIDGLVRFRVWNPRYLREALAFGLPLVPHMLGGFLLFSADRFVINSNLGLADAGVYAVASQLVSVMSMVFGAVNNAYVPWLFERLKADVAAEKIEVVKYTYAWFILILFSVGIAYAVGPWVVMLIAGAGYEKAGEVVGLLALSQAFGGMYLMVTNYIFYSKRTIYLSMATLLSGLINLVLLPIMVGSYGLKGAAGAACIANGFLFLMTWWLASKLHPMPWSCRIARELKC